MNPIVIGEGLTHSGGDVFGMRNIKNLVIDGMNNLKLVAGTEQNNQKPRSLIFLGGDEGYDSSENVVIKNIELDGMFYDIDETYWGSNGAKWGYKGSHTSNIALCNLDVHNIREQHGFYQNVADKNLEFVHNTIDTVQWTCIQVRSDEVTPETLKIIIADNVCSNSCDASAITVSDPGNTWIHGNTVIDTVGGFASLDSDGANQYPDEDKRDHRFANIYLYNNKFLFDQDPIQNKWDPPNNACATFRSKYNFKKGGADFYSQNNVFIYINEAAQSSRIIYSRESTSDDQIYYPDGEVHIANLAESDNNVYGLGQPGADEQSRFGQWGWQSLTDPVILNSEEWQMNMEQYDKLAYDTNSRFEYGPEAVQELIDEYFY